MKPWMILLSSAVVAVAAAAGAALPELSSASHSGVAPSLVSLGPMLVVTGLAGYALCAVLLATASLVGSCVMLRYRLARLPPYSGPGHRDWAAAFEASGLRRLAPAPAVLPLRREGTHATAVVQTPFRAHEARREMASLYYISAARSHFFSALIVLAAAAALGLAQQHGAPTDPLGPVPAIPAALILIGLILLAVLGRLAVDVAVEPLIELLRRLPVEPIDTVLLRRAVELLDAGAEPIRGDVPSSAAPEIAEHLIGLFEEGRRALVDAIAHLSSSTEGLTASTRLAIEGIETALRDSDRHLSPVSETAIIDTAELSRLRDAVVALTAALERRPIASAEMPQISDNLPRGGRETDPQFAAELKQLLAEIGTAC